MNRCISRLVMFLADSDCFCRLWTTSVSLKRLGRPWSRRDSKITLVKVGRERNVSFALTKSQIMLSSTVCICACARSAVTISWSHHDNARSAEKRLEKFAEFTFDNHDKTWLQVCTCTFVKTRPYLTWLLFQSLFIISAYFLIGDAVESKTKSTPRWDFTF